MDDRFVGDDEFPTEDAPAPASETQTYNFNPDPEWQTYAATFEAMIQKIALKYCSSDENLREDVMQEARIALATVVPEAVAGFEDYLRGVQTEDQWLKKLRAYCGNVIRNSILSYLDSYPKGNWYNGRTRHVKDRRTGESRKVYLQPRFSSLDMLVDEFGMQVDQHGAISWPDPSDDGIVLPDRVANRERWGRRFLSDGASLPEEE